MILDSRRIIHSRAAFINISTLESGVYSRSVVVERVGSEMKDEIVPVDRNCSEVSLTKTAYQSAIHHLKISLKDSFSKTQKDKLNCLKLPVD